VESPGNQTAAFPRVADVPSSAARSRTPAATSKRSTERESGYPDRKGVPYISWISAPLYLIDDADTLDRSSKNNCPLAATVTRWSNNSCCYRRQDE